MIYQEYYRGGDLGRGCDRHPELRDPRKFKLMVAEVVRISSRTKCESHNRLDSAHRHSLST